MATQDVSIWNEGQTKAVTVITDSSEERLAVDAKISNTSPIPTEVEVTYEINSSKAYFAPGNFATLAGNSTLTVLLITPASPTIDLHDMSVNITKNGNADPCLIRLWEGATTTANGTTLTSYNCDRSITTAAAMTSFTAPTVTSTGTKIIEYVAHSDWETYVAPSYTSPFKLKLKPNTKYLFQLVNTSNQAVTFTYFLFWSE